MLNDLITNNDLSSYGESKINLFNNSKRLPIILLIDASLTMSKYDSFIKNSVDLLYTTLFSDRAFGNAIELSIITFNSSVKVQEKLREIRSHEIKGKQLNYNYNSKALIGIGLRSAIQQIEFRKKVYFNARPKVRFYCPILIFVSNIDTYTDCNDEKEKLSSEFSKQYIHKNVTENRLIVLSCGISGEGNKQILQSISGLDNDSRVFDINNEDDISSICYLIAHHLLCSGMPIRPPKAEDTLSKIKTYLKDKQVRK